MKRHDQDKPLEAKRIARSDAPYLRASLLSMTALIAVLSFVFGMRGFFVFFKEFF